MAGASLLAFPLRLEQSLPHSCPVVPTTTQLGSLEHLTLFFLLLLSSLLPLLFPSNIFEILLLELRCYALVCIAICAIFCCFCRVIVNID